MEDGQKISFHAFPKDTTRKDRWLHFIRRDENEHFKVTNHSKVCSRHFQTSDFLGVTPRGRRFLKPDAIPSVFPWKAKKERKPAARKTVGCLSDSNISVNVLQKETVHIDEPSVEDQLTQKIADLEMKLKKQAEAAEYFQRERDYLRKVCTGQRKVETKRAFGLDRFVHRNVDISFYTGFPTMKSFLQCLALLDVGENGENIIYKGINITKKNPGSRKLSVRDEFFLTLIRIRCGFFEAHLAHLFNIGKGTVNRIVTSWINYIYVKLGSFSTWPTQKQIRETMPESMKNKCPTLEWIIDACEMQCEWAKSLVTQSQSYSSYKNRNTMKCLVACTPSGQIGFVSKLYTGNISDREIVKRSGFLNMPHNRGACWLVDKGFQIQDLADPLGVKINIPPFVGKQSQLTAEEVYVTQSIASERIHMERVINKIKNFHVFDTPIPLSTVGTVNQTWGVCAWLTMFQNPIISL